MPPRLAGSNRFSAPALGGKVLLAGEAPSPNPAFDGRLYGGSPTQGDIHVPENAALSGPRKRGSAMTVLLKTASSFRIRGEGFSARTTAPPVSYS